MRSTPPRRVLLGLAAAALVAGPAGAGPPLEHFFAAPELRSFKLSPDGTHLAAISPKDDAWRLVVLAVDPIRIVQEISVKKRPIHDFWWANEERLLLSLSWKDGRTLRLAGANRNGARTVDFGKKIAEGGRWPTELHFHSAYPQSRDNVLVSFRFPPSPVAFSSGLVSTEVVRFNAYTGRSTVVAGSNTRGFAWLPDPEGEIRFGYAQVHEDGYYLYRKPEALTWSSLRQVGGMEVDRLSFRPLGWAPGEPHPVVASRHQTDRFALYGYDAEKDIFSEVLFAHPEVDVVGPTLRSRNAEVLGVRYWEDEWKEFWIDPVWRQRAERIGRALPGVEARIVEWDDAQNRFLVEVDGDRRPPLTLLYTGQPESLKPVASLYPHLQSDELADSRRADYTARDGRRIPAYLTRPADRDGEPLPLVVLVHDAPWSRHGWIRFWQGRVGRGFDPEVQFLASRGWAVFRPNYRGSSGFGHAHEAAGFGHWGGAMQDDLEDGVRWLIEQGVADPKRICIYGQGYGGYAAVSGLVKTPGLYRCAAAYDGVYDLPAFRSKTQTQWFVYDSEIEKRVGEDPARLAQVSPARHAAAIRAPLLLAWGDEGGNNWTWARAQFDAMADALEDAERPFVRVELPKDGQGLGREANRMRFYEALERFLEEHLAAPTPP